MRRFIGQALVIARRDFSAIVLTPTFLIFLLAPIFMFAVATIGSLGAVRFAQPPQLRLIVLTEQAAVERLRAAEQKLRRFDGPEPPLVEIRIAAGDPVEQAKDLLRAGTSAVLIANRANPRIIRKEQGAGSNYLTMLWAASSAGTPAVTDVTFPSQPIRRDHAATGFGAVFVMFLLTLILAGQTISMLAEERNNKVIEILAAAIPLEAMFLGKLVGMLGVALVFTLFWGGIAGAALWSGTGRLDLSEIAPAGGLIPFAALFLGYFVLAFLLLGAVFLGIGAQASSPREIQMLSLPVTIFQVSMFALASAGAGNPDSWTGLAAAAFPFSSPFAMAARAASAVPAWQHALAFAWQLLWLAVTVIIAARSFRRGVLKSGGGAGR